MSDTPQGNGLGPPQTGWTEFREQLREWRDAVDRRLPSWWPRALAFALIGIGIVLPFAFSQTADS